METGLLFNIQRFSVHDGPGIRTDFFFKGCPLRCGWCHNPEGWKSSPEISYLAHRCIGCQACVSVCPEGVHNFTGGLHQLDFKKCTGCGKCALSCSYGALELQGKPYTVEELLDIARRDCLFYGEKGGVTLTGGEPMLQKKFVLKLSKALKEAGFHVCMETSGYGDSADFLEIAPFIDRFLFDIKETDEKLHRQYTGGELSVILKNLALLNEKGAVLQLRCPIIPDVNLRESHFKGICDLANRFENIIEIDLEPYHSLGLGKAQRLGATLPYTRQESLTKEDLLPWQEQMKSWTKVPVLLP